MRTAPSRSQQIGSTLQGSGSQRRPDGRARSAGTRVIGMRLRPGIAESTLGLPISELVGLDVELDDLWGADATTIGQRLAEAGPAPLAALLLEQGGPPADGARLLRIRSSRLPSAVSSPGVPKRASASRRQISTSHHGSCDGASLTPSATAPRHSRESFAQGFLALAHGYRGRRFDLRRLAQQAGYADRAHLTRERRCRARRRTRRPAPGRAGRASSGCCRRGS